MTAGEVGGESLTGDALVNPFLGLDRTIEDGTTGGSSIRLFDGRTGAAPGPIG